MGRPRCSSLPRLRARHRTLHTLLTETPCRLAAPLQRAGHPMLVCSSEWSDRHSDPHLASHLAGTSRAGGATMPKMMRAVQVSKPGGSFELTEREVPEPAPGQVGVEVEACGICHSDALVKFGQYPGLALPRIPGHEIAGRIDKVGANVTEWKKGDRVGIGWHGGHCFVCNACRKGLFINCERAQVTGISYDGGYAEYVVAPHEAIARIPEKLEATEAAPLHCAGLT